MMVSVKLFASLRSFGPNDQVIGLPDQSTIADVICYLKIPSAIRLLRIVNGEHRSPEHVLQNGDELALFPPIAGG